MIEQLTRRYGPGLLPDQVAASSSYNLRHLAILNAYTASLPQPEPDGGGEFVDP